MPRESISAARSGWWDAAFLVTVLVVAGALDLRLSRSFDPVWFLLFLPVIVVVHEAGHAVASLLLGHRIFEFRIGAGPALRLKVGATHVLIGPLPVSGHVASGSTSAPGFRWKRLLIVAAGPATNALMLGVGVPFLPSNLLRDFAVVNAFVLINNLLPFSQRTPLGPQRPTGSRSSERCSIRTASSRSSAPRYRPWRRNAWWSSVTGTARGRRCARPWWSTRTAGSCRWLGHDLVVSGRLPEAREVFSSLVEDDERREDPVLRRRHLASSAIHLNNLAWADLRLADPGLVAEANAASARAIELLPGASAIWGTMGFALIATGHFAEGVTLAQKAFRKERDPMNRASQACVVAIGYARNWRFAESERWHAIARSLDARCALDRVTEELAARRPPASDPVPDAG